MQSFNLMQNTYKGNTQGLVKFSLPLKKNKNAEVETRGKITYVRSVSVCLMREKYFDNFDSPNQSP